MSDLLIGLQPTFLECIVIFLYAAERRWLLNFVLVASVTVDAL